MAEWPNVQGMSTGLQWLHFSFVDRDSKVII